MSEYTDQVEAYFKQQEMAQIKKLREQHLQEKLSEERQAQKNLHYMHCPKCGDKMQAEDLEGIEIDKCPSCLGIYFDNAELEQLLETKFEKRKGIIKKIFNLG